MAFWANKAKKELAELKAKHRVTVKELKSSNVKYKNALFEIQALKAEIKHKEEKQSGLTQSDLGNPKGLIKQKVSKERIQEFVTKMLENPEVNIGFLPDIAEKKIYENVLTMLLNIVNESIDTVSVEFMGHRLKFFLESL